MFKIRLSICLLLSLALFGPLYGQKKSFEGALYYKIFSADGIDEYNTVKIIFSNKKVMVDSVMIDGQYYKAIFDPASLNAYFISHASGDNQGFTFPLNDFFESVDAFVKEEYYGRNAFDSLGSVQILSSNRGKKIAGLETRSTSVTLISGEGKDTLPGTILLNTSLHIKFKDYDQVFQRAFRIAPVNTKFFKSLYNVVMDGLPVLVELQSPEKQKAILIELLKVEATNKYNTMFDISNCKFEKKTGFLFGDE